MKALLGSVILYSITALAQTYVENPIEDEFIAAGVPSTEQELAPYLVLAIESTEELENYFLEGYPTLGIQAILDDETIPEEDRYWLDCRIRSTIAQRLHRFYNQKGILSQIDAEWISPGENYWQEVMVIQPPSVQIVEPTIEEPQGEISVVPRNRRPEIRLEGPTVSTSVDSGTLYTLYGEQIGQLAAVLKQMRTSRDGSLAVMRTGGRHAVATMSLPANLLFCFMSSDGSYIEIDVTECYPKAFSGGNTLEMISQDGSISVWNIFSIIDHEPRETHILVHDMQGNEIENHELPRPFWLACCGISVSSDNNFIACAGGGFGQGSGIIDRRTGEIEWFNEATGRTPVFSENSRFCAIGGSHNSASSYIIDLENQSYSRLPIERSSASTDGFIGNTSISNDGRIVVVSGAVYLDGENVLSLPDNRFSSLSPNGYFCISSYYSHVRAIEPSQVFLTLDSLLEITE